MILFNEKNLIKKFDILKKILNKSPKTEYIYSMVVSELVFLVLSVEKILINKHEKNIYKKPIIFINNMLLKLNVLNKSKEYSSNKKIIKRNNNSQKINKDLFQVLWCHYNKKEFIEERLKPYIERMKLNNLEALVKNKKCVDFGCGHGQFLMSLKKLGAKECLGLDFGKNSIRYANKISKLLKFNRKSLKFIYSTVLKTKLRSNEFDFAIQNGVFHHLKNLSEEKKAYKEVYRVLKKNGYFFVFTGGSGGLRNIIFDNCQQILKDIDIYFIIKQIRNMPISNNKKYMLSDNLIAKYRNTEWVKIIEMLNKIGFRFIRPLRGHARTDFDKDFLKDKNFKAKFGEGHIRLLCQKIN